MDMGIKIIVVDDLETMRISLQNILEHLGFSNVIGACDGQHALEIMRSEKVDLLITDLDMPKMGGLALLRAVRSEEALKKLPVLLLTADAAQSSIREAAQSGADDYLLKPFTKDALEQRIKKMLGD